MISHHSTLITISVCKENILKNARTNEKQDDNKALKLPTVRDLQASPSHHL